MPNISMADSQPPPFAGFHKPTANFFRLPNEWTDIAASMSSLAELKIVLYILKHTWGYSEFDVVKKITTDEFMHGRKDRRGNRIDRGTGLSKQSVLDGLALAVAHRLLLVEVDDSDRARIKKYYKLRMRDADLGEGDDVPRGAVKQLDPDVKKIDTGVHEVDSGGQASRPRSEEETRKERYKNVQNVDYSLKPDHTGYQTPTRSIKSNGRSREEVAYFARTLADKLGDQKSLTYYTLLCARFDPHRLLRKAAEIVGDGGARKPGAVFAAWIKTLGPTSTFGLPHPSQPPNSA